MIVSKKQSQRNTRNAITGSENIWPDAIVPYVISDAYTGK